MIMGVKEVSQTITRPVRTPGYPDIHIPISKDMITNLGALQAPRDVDFYSRSYPLESQNVTHSPDWVWV
jgi:hypothetical protein